MSPTPATLTHLQRLEAESIQIFREVVAECENPVMLYSIGKDSATMLHLARKAFYTVVPVGPSYALHSTRYRAASIASYLLILPFAVGGLGRLWRLPGRPSALLLLAASSLLVCVVFFPQERFRIPVIDPTLIVCAGGLAARPRA